MSIDVDWEALTGGPDGEELASAILDFINDRFQKVSLPKFIRSVKAHSFEFGSVPPFLEVKDVCDPLGDFYETDADEDDDGEGAASVEFQPGGKGLDYHPDTTLSNQQNAIGGVAPRAPSSVTDAGSVASAIGQDLTSESLKHLNEANRHAAIVASQGGRQHADGKGAMQPPAVPPSKLKIHNLPTPGHSHWSPIDVASSAAFLSRSSTPGIPGGTSNMSYFHSPFSTGLPTSASAVFASMAGGQLANSLMEHRHSLHDYGDGEHAGPSGSSSAPLPDPGLPKNAHIPSETGTPSGEKSVNDIQIVAHVRYSGDVKLTLTADILLDYPMPSFVGIPLKLNVTGMTFDGVAIIAYIKRKAHFCFLSPDDAEALIGRDTASQGEKGEHEKYDESTLSEDEVAGKGEHGEKEHHHTYGHRHSAKSFPNPVGGLLEEIRVESEIGQKEPGKQVLKNVGKVERFVLEQVRRIFENEFVYPSFWTFLV